MFIIFLGFVALVAVSKLQRRKRKIVFQIISRTNLPCGCLLDREEINGTVNFKPCNAHKVMAESL